MKKKKVVKRDTSIIPKWVAVYFEDDIISNIPINQKTIKQLKKREDTMKGVYHAIEKKLNQLPLCPGIRFETRTFPVMDAIMDSAANYGPDIKWKQREVKRQLTETQGRIIKTAKELIALLKEYKVKRFRGVTGSFLDTDLFYLIDRAGENNPLYKRLFARYFQGMRDKNTAFGISDSKYYPSIDDILRVLIQECAISKPKIMNPEDARVLSFRKASRSDFIRSLLECIEREKREGKLPKKFNLSQKSIGEITASVFDLADRKDLDSVVSKALSRKKS